MIGEFGVVANVIEVDKVLRLGAKVWVLGGWAGGGFERVIVIGLTRSSHEAEKYVPITRLGNFRAAWMPEHLRRRVTYFGGAKEDMTRAALSLAEVAGRERAAHAGRGQR